MFDCACLNLIPIVTGFVGLYLLRRWYKGGQCTSKARMDGKVVVITGCNTGIGKETVVDLCNRGAKVIMACRSKERMQAAADEVMMRTNGKANIVQVELDLSSFESIRTCAKRINETEEKIDVLINNGGVMMCPFMQTKDGLEMQIGTNHFGHFLFTNLLLDKIKAAAPSRIVTVSSRAHTRTPKMDLEDMKYENKPYHTHDVYAQSKLANVLFSQELARRLKGTGVTTYSLHPGAVFTDLGRHIEDYFGPFKFISQLIFYPICMFWMKTAKDGAQTTITCAVDPMLEGETGKYYSDCEEHDTSPAAKDDMIAKQLWDISEKVVGLRKD